MEERLVRMVESKLINQSINQSWLANFQEYCFCMWFENNEIHENFRLYGNFVWTEHFFIQGVNTVDLTSILRNAWTNIATGFSKG